MFTGLVEAVGTVVDHAPIASGVRLRIASPLARALCLGDSVAVNGVCLTATAVDDSSVCAEVGPETLRVTTLGALGRASVVNLERPLRADGRLGGHFVQGHVDGVGTIESLRSDADFWWLTVNFPEPLARYLVLKGSVAIDGISLTVARLRACQLDVQLVPFTVEHTNLKLAKPGDRINLECDMLGKYVARAVDLYTTNGKANQAPQV